MELGPRVASGLLAACALMSLARPAASAPTATVKRPATRAVIRADQLSERQFRKEMARLADTDVVEVEGRRLTVAELRARNTQRVKEAAGKAAVTVRPRRASLEARLLELETRRREALAATNAKALAEFRRLAAAAEPDAGGVDAIRGEALELQARAKGASPAERARIEARAAELLDRLARSKAVPPPTTAPAPRYPAG